MISIKRVVSVSLGSSHRDHKVNITLRDEEFEIERKGTDGSIKKMEELIKELDGHVECFGLGGMDLYLTAGKNRYIIKQAARVVKATKKTPIVDGSGLKNTLERQVVKYLAMNTDLLKGNKKVLMVSCADRFGMAEAFQQEGCNVACGDLIFALGVPYTVKSIDNLARIAKIIAPVVCRLPFKFLYPTGDKQKQSSPKHKKSFKRVDIIAGDFHFIRRYLPEDVTDKMIVTNTVTSEDVEFLKARGLKTLVTTTPELNGRSFGTNVMEALLVALNGSKRELSSLEYQNLLTEIDMKPRIVNFY